MKKILITRKLIKDSEEKASKIFEANLNSNDELYSQSKLIEKSKGYDAILTSLTDKMDEETISKLPDTIKIISNFAVGFGNIDLEAAKKRGIVVTNTPEVLSDATAEIGILLILGACRRVSEGIQSAKESNWKWSADYLIGKQLTGTRLGILGMGRIGQKIASIAKSLGMIIHYHNRSKLGEEKEQGAVLGSVPSFQRGWTPPAWIEPWNKVARARGVAAARLASRRRWPVGLPERADACLAALAADILPPSAGDG